MTSTMQPVILTLLVILYGESVGATKWRASNALPDPTFPRTTCRLLINEISLSTEQSMKKQFVEIARYCPFDDSYQRSVSMVGVKLVFITYHGFIHGICSLDGRLESRTKHTEVPGTRKKRKITEKYWIYLVGAGYAGVDFEREKCQLFPTIIAGEAKDNEYRFLLGVDFPVGIALIYNQHVDVLKDIKLDHNGVFYEMKKIDQDLEDTIINYMQDFYGSKSKYQYCDYFSRFYSYEPSKYSILRDWNTRNQSDKSLSRCSKSDMQNQVLPMQPQLWLTTQPSPGSINLCQQGYNFFIENYQDQRPSPLILQYGDDLKLKCYSFTLGETLYGQITSEQNYLEQMEYVETLASSDSFHSTTELSTTEFSPTEMESADNVCVWESASGSSNFDPIPNEIEPSTLTNEEFEAQLESSKPFIWDDSDCKRFTDEQRHEVMNIPSKPIDLADILEPDTCNWFEYLSGNLLFRCKLCNSLLKQGIIFDAPNSQYVTGIMKAGVLSFHSKNKKYDNRIFINEHKKSKFHQMSTQWFSLYDKGLRGANLEQQFYHKPGAFTDYIKSTKNFMIVVKQAVRLGVPFNKFKILSEMLVHFNIDIGTMYQNFNGMKTAVSVISDKMHKDFCRDLIRYNGPFTILLDGTTDIQTIPVVAVLIETYTAEEGTKIHLYKILKLEKGESGQQIFDALMKEIREDGLEEFLKNNLHAVTSDGALNVLSVFNRLLNEITVHKVLPVWCGCHLVDIFYKNTVRKYPPLERVSRVINSVYRIFSKSSKKKEILKTVALEYGQQPFTIKRVHAIRWVSSNLRGFEIILKGWKVIIEALTRIASDNSIPPKTREPFKNVIKDLKDPMFLSSLAFLVYIGKILSDMLLAYEKKGTTLIAKKSLRDEFKQTLESLIEAELDSVKYLTDRSMYIPVGSIVMAPVGDLKTFESQQVEFQEVVLNAPETSTVGKRLYDKQEEYILTILDFVDFYYSPDIQDNFDVLDPLQIPLDASEQALYGTQKVSELNTELKWGYEQQELLSSWTVAVKYITTDSMFSEMKVKTPEQFWEYYLSSASINLSDSVRGVISKALTVSASNAESERVLSLYSRVKTYQRFMLLPKTVEGILRVRINSDQAINDLEAQEHAKAFILAGNSRSDAVKTYSDDLDERNWDELVTFEEIESDDIEGDEDDDAGCHIDD